MDDRICEECFTKDPQPCPILQLHPRSGQKMPCESGGCIVCCEQHGKWIDDAADIEQIAIDFHLRNKQMLGSGWIPGHSHESLRSGGSATAHVEEYGAHVHPDPTN